MIQQASIVPALLAVVLAMITRRRWLEIGCAVLSHPAGVFRRRVTGELS
jgi:hypothetical protein